MSDSVLDHTTDDPELERLLEDFRRIRRCNIYKSMSFEVDLYGNIDFEPLQQFSHAGMDGTVARNVAICGYHDPTPVQSHCIPAIQSGLNVLTVAPRGSGQTAAYMIPTISQIIARKQDFMTSRADTNSEDDVPSAKPFMVIICPTQDMARQTFIEVRLLCYNTGLRTCVTHGGVSRISERQQFKMGCDILIATPGRLKDHVQSTGLLSLQRLQFTILDEADALLRDSWASTMDIIHHEIDASPENKYLVFTSRLPRSTCRAAREILGGHCCILIIRAAGIDNIQQNVLYLHEDMKKQYLEELMFSIDPQRLVVIANSRRTCDEVDEFIYNTGLPSTVLHSGLTHDEREISLDSFRRGKKPILVMTPGIARGLALAHVSLMINYDLPSNRDGEGISDYFHQINLVSPVSAQRKAISFFNNGNKDIAAGLVQFLQKSNQAVPDFLERVAQNGSNTQE